MSPGPATRSLLAASIALSALLAACGDNQEPEEADALWDRVQSSGYRDWTRAPGYEARQTSAAPHGGAVDIYVNDVIQGQLTAGAAITEWPMGSWIVKDGWDGEALELVATMEKREGGWFWAEWDAEGNADFSGEPSLCTDCHASGADFVRAFGFPSP